ncbi:hypothetical protein F4678DRAFT_231289 [Xylaria arbuscula]|nr:hypothetical protein F4678DRAFT_231289 [Xylaria arbuscula]
MLPDHGWLAATAGSLDHYKFERLLHYASGSDSPYAMQVMAVSFASLFRLAARSVLGQVRGESRWVCLYVCCTKDVRVSVWHTPKRNIAGYRYSSCSPGCQQAPLHSHRPFNTTRSGSSVANAALFLRGRAHREGKKERQSLQALGSSRGGCSFLPAFSRDSRLSQPGLSLLPVIAAMSVCIGISRLLTPPFRPFPSCIRCPDSAVAQFFFFTPCSVAN